MTTVNIPLLRKAVEWVEAQDKLPDNDREWNQLVWASRHNKCGSVRCVAGYVVQITHPEIYNNFLKLPPALQQRNGGEEIAELARQELGLLPAEADELFFDGNEASDVRNLAEEFAGEKL